VLLIIRNSEILCTLQQSNNAVVYFGGGKGLISESSKGGIFVTTIIQHNATLPTYKATNLRS